MAKDARDFTFKNLSTTVVTGLSHCVVWTCLWLGTSCGSADFTSANGNHPTQSANVAAKQVPASPAIPTPVTAVPDSASSECTAAGTTKAELLTQTVDNGTPGNFVEYKLTVTDCSGKQIPFNAGTVSFDLGSYVGAQSSLNYVISDASDQSHSISGIFNNLQGHDLFGNAGPNYYHYETDKPVNFAAAANAIIVHVDLAGMSMTPYGSNDPLTMNTYLAFGTTAPVKAPVRLSRPGPAQPPTLGGLLGSIFK
jgi:hypothetical protein